MEKKIVVTVEGLSPLLMHAYPLVEMKAFDKLSKEEQAEHAAYRVPETKELYIPAIAMQRALVSGASFSKGKGRSTLQKQVAAGVLIEPQYLLLGAKEYKIHSMPVVIPATKGRTMRHRPIFEKWKVDFTITYDPELLTATQMRSIVDDTGRRTGILDFRPERKGPYGRFQVTSWNAE